MLSAIDFGKEFLTQYFNKRDIDAAAALLADDVIWITPDEIRHLRSRKSARDFIVSALEDDPNAYNVDVAAVLSVPNLGDGSVVVYEINIIPKGKETAVNLRCSIGMRRLFDRFEIPFIGMSRRYHRTDVEQIRTFADALPGGIMTLTCVHREVQPMYASAFFCTKLGYEEGVFYDRLYENPFFMLSVEEQKRMRTLVAEMSSLRNPKPLSMQVNLVHADGSTTIPTNMTIAAAYKDGEKTVLYLTFDEVSDLLNEAERQKKKELHAASEREEKLRAELQRARRMGFDVADGFGSAVHSDSAGTGLDTETAAGVQDVGLSGKAPKGSRRRRGSAAGLQEDAEQQILEIRRDAERQIAAAEIEANVRVDEALRLAREEADAAEQLIRTQIEKAAREKKEAIEKAEREKQAVIDNAEKEKAEAAEQARRQVESRYAEALSKEKERQEAERGQLTAERDRAQAAADEAETELNARSDRIQALEERCAALEQQLQANAETALRQQEVLRAQLTQEKDEALGEASAQHLSEVGELRSQMEQEQQEATDRQAELSNLISQQQRTMKEQESVIRRSDTDRRLLVKEKDKSIHRMETLLAGELRAIGSTAAAVSAGENPDPAEMKKQLAKIAATADEIPGMAKDLAAIADYDPSERKVVQEPFLVSSCLDLARRVIRPICRQKGVIFSAGSAGNMPDAVTGNKSGLQLAILCVLENAADNTLSGGSITLSARADKPVRGSAYYHFTVKDSGQGISEDHLRILFDDPGSELAIARKVIASMGGSIQVRSREGEGSTFEIRVNLKLQPQDRKNAEKPPCE